MTQALLQKRMHLVALAALLALVAAMFVAFAPARAHDLGECDDPEYLTAVKCRMEVGHDGDSDPTTPNVPFVFGTDPEANDPWTSADHTTANHPPTLTISLGDSDGIVAAGTNLVVTVTASGILAATPDTDDDGELSEAEIAAANGTNNVGTSAGSIALSWVRVSGELDDPEQDATGTAGERGQLGLAATASATDDASASSSSFEIIIPAGTTERVYTVSAQITGAFDYGANDVTDKVATKTFTVGDAGVGLSTATLSYGNRVPDDKATVTDESRAETGSDVADGDGINLVVMASNSLGNKSNDDDVTQVTVIAPGGIITITGELTADSGDGDDRETATGTNSASLGGTTATARVMVGQSIAVNVKKADQKPGTVDVYVILTGNGAAISETFTLSFTGDASSLALAEASGSLHNQMVTSEGDGDDMDHRDKIMFALSATDAGGNNAGVPKVSINVHDPNGKRIGNDDVARMQGANAAGVPNALITLETKKAAPASLMAGEWKIEVASGENKAEQTFHVVGLADGIAVEIESNTDPVQVGSLLTVTATVTSGDANVPEKTPVTFTAAGALKLVAVDSDGGNTANSVTKAGVAMARFVVSEGSGLGTIIASAGNASGTASVSTDVVEAAAPEPMLTSISLTLSDADGVGSTVTATAAVAGDEGTHVTFSSSNANVAAVSGAATMAASEGSASASFVVTGYGTAVISASGGGQVGSAALTVAMPEPEPEPEPAPEVHDASGLASQTLNSFTTWSASNSTTASQVFPSLAARGANSLLLWNGSAWVRYSMADGALVPGSLDFPINPGDVLYIGG